jgi:nitroreductase
MNTIEAIMSRRSIRKFKDAPVTDEQIKTILGAAMNAPSAGDGRPWHFIVTKDRDKLNALAEKVDGGNDMLKEAQAAILVCSNEAKEGFPGFYPQDCACASENIYLAAHELGLGTVWVATWNVPPRIAGCEETLNLPEGIKPFALFPLGVANEDLPAENRYDEAKVSWQ